MFELLAFFEGFQRWAYDWINEFVVFVDSTPAPYAFAAGMVATVNPCGFIMLPSFAAFYMTAEDGEQPRVGQRALAAVRMGAIITVAFAVTFGVVGVILTSGGRFIISWIGWAGLAIGIALVALGAYQLFTRQSLFANMTSNVRIQRSSTTRGVIAFGIAYAVASLGCTLPIFMLVVGSIFTGSGGYVDSVGRFLQYAGGMGLMLTMITVGVAFSRQVTVGAVSRALPVVESVGNAAMIFAGAYLVWYWTSVGNLL
jgi:cytochrome c-type biogenesis protein